MGWLLADWVKWNGFSSIFQFHWKYKKYKAASLQEQHSHHRFPLRPKEEDYNTVYLFWHVQEIWISKEVLDSITSRQRSNARGQQPLEWVLWGLRALWVRQVMVSILPCKALPRASLGRCSNVPALPAHRDTLRHCFLWAGDRAMSSLSAEGGRDC